jgi:hypothetical protein
MLWLAYVCYVGTHDGVAPKHVECMVYEICNAGSYRKKKLGIDMGCGFNSCSITISADIEGFQLRRNRLTE